MKSKIRAHIVLFFAGLLTLLLTYYLYSLGETAFPIIILLGLIGAFGVIWHGIALLLMRRANH